MLLSVVVPFEHLLSASCTPGQQINPLAPLRFERCLCITMSALAATEISVKLLQIKPGLVCTAVLSPSLSWPLMNFGQFRSMNAFTVSFTRCEALEMCSYCKKVARLWLCTAVSSSSISTASETYLLFTLAASHVFISWCSECLRPACLSSLLLPPSFLPPQHKSAVCLLCHVTVI